MNARGVSYELAIVNEQTDKRTNERTDGRMSLLARSLRARIYFRAALDRCPLRGDPVLEIGIDVIRYAPNRYPEGKSETEETGRKREKNDRWRTSSGLYGVASTVRLATVS